MTTVMLVTGREMPEPDPETPLLRDALLRRGVDTRIEPWGATDPGADLVVIRTPWDYVEHVEQFLAWAATTAECADVINPPSVLSWNSHKSYLSDLEAAGVPVVPTTVVRSGAPTAEQRAALAAYDEVVVKPAVGSGARGALRTRSGSPEGAEHLASLLDQCDVLVQPYLASVATTGETSLIVIGGEVTHAVLKRPAAGDYRVQQHHGGTIATHRPTDEEREVARRALACSPGAASYARIDLVEGVGGPLVMELELIEPFLFLGFDPGAVERFADLVVNRLEGRA